MAQALHAVFVIAVAVGCDGGEREGDSGWDADPWDAAREPDANQDARRMTVYVHSEGRCHYSDYGSPCSAACDLDPDVPIQFTVTWSGPYCCNIAGGPPDETFLDCRCRDGFVRCPHWPYRDLYTVPTSHCEFCPGTPSGHDPGEDDSGFGEDAGTSGDANASDDAAL